MEEVDAREFFKVVYRHGGMLHRLTLVGVVVIETNGFFVAFAKRQYSFEESFWNIYDMVDTYTLVFGTFVYRSTYYIYGVLVSSPLSACLFEFFS